LWLKIIPEMNKLLITTMGLQSDTSPGYRFDYQAILVTPNKLKVIIDRIGEFFGDAGS